MEVVETGDVELLTLAVPVRAAFEIYLAASVEDELFNPCEQFGRELEVLEVGLGFRHNLVVVVVGGVLPEVTIEALGFQRVLEGPWLELRGFAVHEFFDNCQFEIEVHERSHTLNLASVPREFGKSEALAARN
ncbi:hypothetical protein AB0M81_29075 [Nocardia fluminea]